MADKEHHKKEHNTETKEAVSEKKTETKKNIHDHLKTKIPVPIFVVGIVVILVLVLTMVKFPYQAKENYIEIQEVAVEKQVDDLANPQDVKVCDAVPSNYRIDYNNFVQIKLQGLNDAYCEARLTVWNNEPTEGEFTIAFTFTVNGKDYEPISLTKKVGGKDKIEFLYTHPECASGDTKSGAYQVIKAPTTQKCEFETTYPKKTVTEIEKKEVPKERLVQKSETLLQKILGTNSEEKV